MKLSKRELRHVLNTMEKIAERNQFSCIALSNGNAQWKWDLRMKYADFFDQSYAMQWDLGTDDSVPRQDVRLTLLAMFWAAGGGE